MHACEMTLPYLRGGLSTCSVVWVLFRYFFPRFMKFLMQLCKSLFQNFENYGSYLLLLEPFTLAQPFFWSLLLLRLSATLSFSFKNDDFSRCFVNFWQFDFLNRYPFCKTTGFTPC